ncbi:MAG: hypothetical protein AAF495_14205 [Pseudomonadota bacterium]
MEEIVQQLIELIGETDEAVEGLNENLDQALAECDVEQLEKLQGYFARACELLNRFLETATDGRVATLEALIGDGGIIEDDVFDQMLEEHAKFVRDRLPNEMVAGAFIDYIREQLISARDDLIEQGRVVVRGDLQFDAVRENVERLRDDVCRAADDSDRVVNVLTLGQLRELLKETSLALKDVAIIGADMLVISGDITFIMAAKAGYSIFSGARSLGQRIGSYTEKIMQFFG